jgi:hypothetical protein
MASNHSWFLIAMKFVMGNATLVRISVMEDSVIEHDARQIPDHSLIRGDVTGRVVFQNGDEQLEVCMANRRPLERVFGVDLIYLNTISRTWAAGVR